MKRIIRGAALTALLMLALSPAQAQAAHNIILFVPDGLRAAIVDEQTAPTLAAIRREGVDFANPHSIFPTFTTANAAAFATGHYPGDTGDFSNVIYPGFPSANVGASLTPFLEQDDVLDELDRHYGGNYLDEESVLAAARMSGFSTATIGKLGPVLIQDVAARAGNATIVIDDDTGNGGVPVAPDIAAAIKAAGLPAGAPPRSDSTPNVQQQKYFLDALTKVVLPRFKAAGKPFAIVFWSRDPDGTQHNQRDSIGALVPGINGPNSLAAIANADSNVRDIRAALDQLGLSVTTDIVVAADHGFSTVWKESKTSAAAKRSYNSDFGDVPKSTLPPGFLAIDLSLALHMPLFDPDRFRAPVNLEAGDYPRRGNGLLGADKANPDIIVAANGGSDLIYLPRGTARALAAKIVAMLLREDYVSGLFVDDHLGAIAGTLPMSAINLEGKALTPTPSIVVNFRSTDTGCGMPRKCAAEIADTNLLQGQGMHGSFSRADTANFMAAIGPDFKKGYRDDAPASNADIGMTLAHVLKLTIAPKGKLTGRVLNEALAGGPDAVPSTATTLRSRAAQGMVTILNYEEAGGTRYLDAGGFAGRTVGLNAAP